VTPSTERGRERILVAVAWPYAAGPRHIGHVAGFGVPSDVFARYHRLRGNDVLMVSGTDEHGTPAMVIADQEGVSPREAADKYNELTRTDLRNRAGEPAIGQAPAPGGSYIGAMGGIMEQVVGAPRTQPELDVEQSRRAALEFVESNPEFNHETGPLVTFSDAI
jgi:hypothetical protein